VKLKMGHEDFLASEKGNVQRVSLIPAFHLTFFIQKFVHVLLSLVAKPFSCTSKPFFCKFVTFLTMPQWNPEDLKAAEEALLPSYQTPFSCYDENEHRSVHLRHQSNLLELFFDLFLAANLATFTESHSIVDKGSLIAYIGFFVSSHHRMILEGPQLTVYI
jgi:hypothetical protein